MANMLAGTKVVVVPPPKPVRRSWRERLLSRPWRPFRTFRTLEHPMWDVMKDGRSCYQFGDTLFVNERQFTELQKTSATPRVDFMRSTNEPSSGR